MFWLSILLAVLIGGFTLFSDTAGIGTQIVALVFAGNAFVRLQRGQPPQTRLHLGVAWGALAISGLAAAIGLYRVLCGAAA